MKRMKVMLFGLLIALVMCGLVFAGGQTGGAAKGKITALAVTHHFTDSMKTLAKEYTEETGIEVEIRDLTEEEFWKKMVIELSSGSPSFDFCTFNHTQTLQMASAGWVEPLMKYINDPKLTSKDYDFADFPPSALKAPTYEGDLYGIPVAYEVNILFYRKDILEKLNIPVPQNMQELYDAAVKIKNAYPDMGGIVNRLQRGQGAMWPVSGYIADYKGIWIDKQGNVSLTDPNTYAAIEMYLKQLKDGGSDAPLNVGWMEALAAFQQGKSGFLTDAHHFMSQFVDPTKSKVVDKVGTALFPAAPDGYRQTAGTTAWALAITKGSKKKEMAWDFIRWLTSKEQALKVAIESGNVARSSIWSAKEFADKYPYPEWRKVCNESIEKYTDDFYFPRSPEIGGILIESDIALQNAFMGQPLMDELKEAEVRIRAIVAKSK